MIGPSSTSAGGGESMTMAGSDGGVPLSPKRAPVSFVSGEMDGRSTSSALNPEAALKAVSSLDPPVVFQEDDGGALVTSVLSLEKQSGALLVAVGSGGPSTATPAVGEAAPTVSVTCLAPLSPHPGEDKETQISLGNSQNDSNTGKVGPNLGNSVSSSNMVKTPLTGAWSKKLNLQGLTAHPTIQSSAPDLPESLDAWPTLIEGVNASNKREARGKYSYYPSNNGTAITSTIFRKV